MSHSDTKQSAAPDRDDDLAIERDEYMSETRLVSVEFGQAREAFREEDED